MANQVVMPKMSETMEEGVVVKWLKREGDRVASGDALAEIETDKAVLELEATTAGVLRKILAQEDTKVPVGQLHRRDRCRGRGYLRLSSANHHRHPP